MIQFNNSKKNRENLPPFYPTDEQMCRQREEHRNVRQLLQWEYQDLSLQYLYKQQSHAYW